MFLIDICIAEDEISQDLCQAYKLTIIVSVIAFIINIVICTYTFTSSTYTSNTAVFRTTLIIDVISCVGFMLDSFSTLLNIPGSSRIASKELSKITFSEDTVAVKNDHFVKINDCAVYKPFLFLILLTRQWLSMIMLVIGLERLLYVCYPLWFRAIRIRRTPIVLFTLCFSLLSSSIAYTNSLFVSPDEITYYSCEVTWAFGDNYGWCQSIMIVLEQFAGWLFVIYSFSVITRKSAILRFGNQREKMLIEKKRIRRSLWLISSTLLFSGIPQLGLVILRVYWDWENAWIKQLISVCFLSKCLANGVIFFTIGDNRKKFITFFKSFFALRDKRRIEASDSIISVSYYVGG